MLEQSTIIEPQIPMPPPLADLARRTDCELVEGFERNIARPGDFREFQKKLKAFCIGQNVELRLSWAPEINRFELEPPHFKPIIGKQYAIMFVRELMGWKVYVEAPGKGVIIEGENWKFLRYEKPWKLYSENDSETIVERDGRRLPKPELWVKDNKVEQVAYPRWVIEVRLPDELEKPKWNADRFEWQGITRTDWLGEYPREGVWKALYVICEHDGLCCDQNAPSFGFCYGWYRDPSDSDLLGVQESLKERESRKLTRGLYEAPSQAELEAYEKKTLEEIAEGEQRANDRIREIILNEITPTLERVLSPSVDYGSQNTLPSSHRSIVPRMILTESEIKAREAQNTSVELVGE